MRKLKIALTLLFAMSLSLFLFACGGDPADNSKQGIKTVVVEVGKDAKVAYTDADTASSWTNAGITVKVNYTDASRESAVIPSDECTWDISAVKWGEVNTTIGYEIKVTPNGQTDGTAVSGTYRVTIGHNWGTASADGTSECGHCHAQMTERDITDVIRYKAFHDGPFTGDASEDKYSTETTVLGEGGGTMMDGVKTITYGTIGIGQTFTLTGHAEVFRAEYTDTPGSDEANSHWFFPIMGVSIGNNSLLVRNDGWVLYDGIGGANVTSDARKLQGFFETGSNGSNGKFDNEVVGDIVEENYNNGVVMPSDAIDWFPYMDGELCRTADYEDGGADIELTWQFRTDNVMVISFNNIDAGKLLTMSFKVPTQTYNIILHGERVVMELDHLSSISTLTNPVYRVDEVTKTDYAEGEMFDASTVKAFANYSQASNVPVAAAVYATLGTETVDLSNTPLTPAMTDFRVVFAGQDPIALTGDKAITVVPSLFTGADSKTELEVDEVVFRGEKAQYAYGAKDGKIVFTATGIANSLTPEQKTALRTDKDFYIAVNLVSRLTGEDLNNAVAQLYRVGVKLGTDDFEDYEIAGEAGFGVIIPVDASMLDKKLTFSFIARDGGWNEEAQDWIWSGEERQLEGQADIVLDLSNLEIPAAASVISGKATIAGGGDVTVVYKADAFKEDISNDIRIYVGNFNLQGADITKAPEPGKEKTLGGLGVEATQDKAAGTLTVVYTLPAADLANATLSYNIRLRIGSDYVNDTVYYAPEVGTPATDAKGVAIATDGIGSVYVQAAGDKLYILLPYAEAGVADLNREVKLNVNAGAATISAENSANAKVYNLSYKLTRAGEISFINASDALAASENTKIEYVVLGSDGVNRGAYVLITADVTVAEVRSEDVTQEYYFELNPAAVEVDTARNIYKVGAKIEEVSVTPTAADKENIVSGDCTEGTAQGISAYAYKGEGTTVLFYYGIQITAAGHDWEDSDNGTQVCSKCHSVKKSKDITNTTVAKLHEEVKEKGMSVSFLVNSKGSSEWAESAVLDARGLKLNLMCLDPWINTAGFAGCNLWPGHANTNGNMLQNGATSNIFLNTVSYLTLTIDPEDGIKYYQNAKLVGHYTTDMLLQNETNDHPNDCTTTVGDLITAILNDAAERGFTVAGGAQLTGSELFINTHALDANGVKAQYDLYIAEHGEIVVPKDDPTYSTRQTMSAEQPVTFSGAYDANPQWLTRIEKGDKLEFEGTLTGAGTNAYNSIVLMLWSGSAPKGNFRSDNFINDEANLTAFEHWAIQKNATGDIAEAKADAASVKITYDWSGSNANQIVITLVITNTADSTKVYTQTYTVVPDEDHLTLDEDHYAVGFSKDACTVSLTKFVKNGVAQEPTECAHNFVSGTCSKCGATIANETTTYTNDTIGFWSSEAASMRYRDFALYKGQTITLEATYADAGTERWNGFITQIREAGSKDNLYFIRPAGDYAYGATLAWGGNNTQMTAPGFLDGTDATEYTALKKTAKTEITIAFEGETITVTYKTYNAAGTEVAKTQVWTATGMANYVYTVNLALDGATANGNISVTHQVVTPAN